MDRFTPPRLLGNPHVQSVLASIKARRPAVRRLCRKMLNRSRPHVLDCGNGARLMGLLSRHNPRVDRMAILIHGWEGGADSLYLLSCAGHLYRKGFDVFRLNLRDHGGTHGLNRGLFHSCRIDEAVGAVKAVHEKFRPERLFLAGFSLGGNFGLRIAVRAPAAGIPLTAVAAVSPVLDPDRTMVALETGWCLYHRYFMKKWRNSLTLKRRLFPEYTDLKDFSRFKTLRDMTAYFAPRYTGFPDMTAYLNGYAITGDRLAALAIPSLIIASCDDPVIPSEDLNRIARPPALTVCLTDHGGHCGFFKNLRLESWAEDRMLRFFENEMPAGGNA